MRNLLVLIACFLAAATSAANALEKGAAHTLTRAAWCKDMLAQCNSAVTSDCKDKPISCVVSGTADCISNFGTGSICMSRARLGGSKTAPVLVQPKVSD
jgi:hypothetical protein